MTDNEPTTIVDNYDQFFDNEEFGDLAKLLDEVTREYKANNLTLLEFIEITDDLTQSVEIAELTDNIDRQKMLAEVFDKMKTVVTLAIGAAK